MNHREKLAQDYVDALSDPQCFCEGRLSSLKMVTSNEPITNKPNCACRHDCRMFDRRPQFGKPIKMWRSSAWGDICEGRKAWEAEQKLEQEKETIDSMEWIVAIGERSWQVKHQTAQMALMLCLVTLRREGMSDVEVGRILNQKLYQIREG